MLGEQDYQGQPTLQIETKSHDPPHVIKAGPHCFFLSAGKHKRYRNLIPILNWFNQFIGISAFVVEIDFNPIERSSLFIKQNSLHAWEPLHETF